MFHGASFFLGMLAAAVIGGFWMLGSGLLHAAQEKRRRILAPEQDSIS